MIISIFVEVEKIVVGPLETNCYLVQDGSKGVIIDPGGEGDLVISRIKRAQWRPEFILLTHGHVDHITAVSQLKKEFPQAKVAIHKLDAPMLESDKNSLGLWSGLYYESIHPDQTLNDEEKFSVSSDLTFEVLHTPGHTPGSVCFLLNDLVIFSGDTLFKNGTGRTDLPGGDFEALQRSLKKLSELPEEMIVYPGHGPETRIGSELRDQGIERLRSN